MRIATNRRIDNTTALLHVARMQGTALEYPMSRPGLEGVARTHWSPAPGWACALSVNR